MTKPDKPRRIPEFSSREEEAEWWDTHDITDYLDDLQPVKVKFARNLSRGHGVNVRLDPTTDWQLRRIADEKGLGPTTLVRMWVKERLKQEVPHR